MFEKDGLIILDKPRGISSFLAVKLVKRAIDCKKAGHMGTLDPLASGVLVIGINKGTKLFEKYLKSEKEYLVEYEFGYETDTLDTEGKVINKNDIVVTKSDILKIIPKFIGKQNQIPPNYSAKKINGKKAYELARNGVQFSLSPKEVELFELEFLKQIKQNSFCFRIHCSSGFYVRCLGRDLAKELSTYCTTLCIQRTKCCGFDITQTESLDNIKNGNYKIYEIN